MVITMNVNISEIKLGKFLGSRVWKDEGDYGLMGAFGGCLKQYARAKFGSYRATLLDTVIAYENGATSSGKDYTFLTCEDAAKFWALHVKTRILNMPEVPKEFTDNIGRVVRYEIEGETLYGSILRLERRYEGNAIYTFADLQANIGTANIVYMYAVSVGKGYRLVKVNAATLM
jgi:hypothetical protein